MVRLQVLTGMRPGELVQMRTRDLDRGGKVWLYRPVRHKTMHVGRHRSIVIGPKGQEILRPLLKLDPERTIFSPKESEKERGKRRRSARKSKVQPSQVAREKRCRSRRRRRAPSGQYSAGSYRRAIHRGCDKAGIAPWSPNRLRHNAAERFRKEFGVEIARCMMGHVDIRTTQLYSSMDEEKAMQAALVAG